MATQPIIELTNVHKFFGDFQALNDVCLTVNLGERVVVCGPSGSGKSTMIRCINHLESHDAGKIVVNGVELTEDMGNVLSIRREVGMVFQRPNPFPKSIYENVVYGLRITGENNRRVLDEAVEKLPTLAEFSQKLKEQKSENAPDDSELPEDES